MAIVLSTPPFMCFFDDNGNPLNGGLVYTYLAATLTPQATYTDQGGLTQNANPVVLDSSGRASIWLDSTNSYKFIVKTSAGVTLSNGTQDNIAPFSTASGLSILGNIAANTILGNNTGSSTSPLALTLLQSLTFLGGFAHAGAGQLQRSSSTQLILNPYKGNQIIFPSGYVYTIGSSGLLSGSISGGCNLNGTGSSSLTAATLYYCYLWYNAGNPVLDFSATGHSTDTTTGIEIKTGDATRVLVGMVYPQAGPIVVDTTTARLVASWHNRINKSFLNNFSTTRTTTSGSLAEINSEIRGLFLTWGDGFSASCTQSLTHSANASPITSAITIDGAVTIVAESNTNITTLGSPYNCTLSNQATTTEGQHYITISGSVNSGTGTWNSGSCSGLSGLVLI